MTIVQTFQCRGCGYRFGPVGVMPFVRERPQVFRYCRACNQAQASIHVAGTELRCVHCASTSLEPLEGACPVCRSSHVEWVSS